MTSIQHYLQDGANPQERGVLAAFQWVLGDGIESSWNKEWGEYEAVITVSRWHNGREQGYVASLYFCLERQQQLNIAWFEHRNSDRVCAVRWEQVHSLNPVDMSTAEFPEGVYRTKADVNFQVGPGEWVKMAEWIKEQFTDFWDRHHTNP